MAVCTHSADSARRPDPAFAFIPLPGALRLGLRGVVRRTAHGAVRFGVTG
jgi:hypothetical protein